MMCIKMFITFRHASGELYMSDTGHNRVFRLNILPILNPMSRQDEVAFNVITTKPNNQV